MNTVAWNPFAAEYKEDPIAYMRAIRETDPVNKGINGRWIVTRYDDVKKITSDPRFIAYDLPDKIQDHGAHREDEPGGFPNLRRAMVNWILYQNPPLHTGNKKAIFKVWSQLDYDAIVRDTTAEYLGKIAGREVDFIEAYAMPLPIRVINHLIGIEPMDDATFRSWSYNVSNTQEPFSGLKDIEVAEALADEIISFLNRQVEIQSKNHQEDNYLSIVTRQTDIDTEALISQIIFLFIAGVETSVAIFGKIVNFFIQRPWVFEQIKESMEHVDRHVEELLRFNNSANYIARMAAEDCEVGGRLIKKGETLYLALFCANQDPEVFDDPETYKVREKNPHLAFGHGAHHCLGSYLSKFEIKIFLERVVEMGLSFKSNGPMVLDRKSIIFQRILEMPVKVISKG